MLILERAVVRVADIVRYLNQLLVYVLVMLPRLLDERLELLDHVHAHRLLFLQLRHLALQAVHGGLAARRAPGPCSRGGGRRQPRRSRRPRPREPQRRRHLPLGAKASMALPLPLALALALPLRRRRRRHRGRVDLLARGCVRPGLLALNVLEEVGAAGLEVLVLEADPLGGLDLPEPVGVELPHEAAEVVVLEVLWEHCRREVCEIDW